MKPRAHSVYPAPWQRGSGAEYEPNPDSSTLLSVGTSPNCALRPSSPSSWWPGKCSLSLLIPVPGLLESILLLLPDGSLLSVVGLWAGFLAGDGAESLRVRCGEVILRRWDGLAVDSDPVSLLLCPSRFQSSARIALAKSVRW